MITSPPSSVGSDQLIVMLDVDYATVLNEEGASGTSVVVTE